MSGDYCFFRFLFFLAMCILIIIKTNASFFRFQEVSTLSHLRDTKNRISIQPTIPVFTFTFYVSKCFCTIYINYVFFPLHP